MIHIYYLIYLQHLNKLFRYYYNNMCRKCSNAKSSRWHRSVYNHLDYDNIPYEPIILLFCLDKSRAESFITIRKKVLQ